MKFKRNPAEKKKAIVETAEQFFYQYGYEKTSVNQIIDSLKISKGAFYHHFTSKISLLDSVTEFIVKRELSYYDRFLFNKNLTALEKFNKIFNVIRRWNIRTGRFIKPVMNALFTDENITMRRKLFRKNIEMVAPKIDLLINEGISSNFFHIKNKENLGEIIINIDYTLNEDLACSILKTPKSEEALQKLIAKLTIYQTIYENLLGTTENSILLFDEKSLRKIFFR